MKKQQSFVLPQSKEWYRVAVLGGSGEVDYYLNHQYWSQFWTREEQRDSNGVARYPDYSKDDAIKHAQEYQEQEPNAKLANVVTTETFELVPAKGDATVETTPFFWDCECDKEYIHIKGLQTHCRDCGAGQSNQPDSRVAEVAGRGFVFSDGETLPAINVWQDGFTLSKDRLYHVFVKQSAKGMLYWVVR